MKYLRRLQKILQWTVILFFATSILSVVAYRWSPVPVTPLMLIRSVQQMSRGEHVRLRHHWVSMDSMSRYLPVAVMASEDQRFMEHDGFDFKAINEAWEERRSPLANLLVGQEGLGDVFYPLDRTILEQGTHHGGLLEFHRDGRRYLWSRGGGTTSFRPVGLGTDTS